MAVGAARTTRGHADAGGADPTGSTGFTRTFPLIKDHVLLKGATNLTEAADEIQHLINEDKINEIVSSIPEDWLLSESDIMSPKDMRAAYIEFINAKLSKIDVLVKEAEDAR